MLSALAAALPERALVRFDFAQKYFRHPGRQVWDFSIVRSTGVYHLYYHTIPLGAPGAANADTIWHATSADLAHWTIRGPVLVTAGAPAWEQGAPSMPTTAPCCAGRRAWVGDAEPAQPGSDGRRRPPLPTAPGLSTLALAPNPANPSARVTFRLASPGPVAVTIHDLRGRRVWQDGPRPHSAGTVTVTWPGCDSRGRPLPSGAYLVRLRNDAGAELSGRLTLLK